MPVSWRAYSRPLESPPPPSGLTRRNPSDARRYWILQPAASTLFLGGLVQRGHRCACGRHAPDVTAYGQRNAVPAAIGPGFAPQRRQDRLHRPRFCRASSEGVSIRPPSSGALGWHASRAGGANTHGASLPSGRLPYGIGSRREPDCPRQCSACRAVTPGGEGRGLAHPGCGRDERYVTGLSGRDRT